MTTAFRSEDEIRDWKNAYGIFGSPDGQKVLDDLMEFCHFLDAPVPKDAFELAMYEGRRQVFLRIFRNLNLTTEEVIRVYRKQWSIPTQQGVSAI